jgi:hypothetical protein
MEHWHVNEEFKNVMNLWHNNGVNNFGFNNHLFVVIYEML